MSKIIKNKIVIAIIIILFLLIGIIGYLFYGKTKKDNIFLISKETFDIAQMSKIIVDGKLGEYNIQFVKSEQCIIEEYANVQLSKDEKYKVEYNGKEFKISNPINNISDISGLKRLNFNIYIPEKIIQEIDLSLDVGNLNIDSEDENIQLEKLKINNNIGDINIKKILNISSVEIINSIGNVLIKKVESSMLNIKSGTGNIDIELLKVENTSKIETDVGDINLGLESDYYINTKTNTGIVNVDKNFKKKNSKNLVELILKNDIGNIIVIDNRNNK